MTAMSNSEFGDYMLQLAAKAPPFKPTATYDADGDCIEFIASPEVYRAQRLDDLVTVYYGQETGHIVGSLIKGISEFRKKIAEKMPGFVIEVDDEPVKLVHIFLAKLWTTRPDAEKIATITYRKLIEIAGNADVEAELTRA
jgi:hypothetical protein